MHRQPSLTTQRSGFWIHHCLTFRSVWVTRRKFPTSQEDRKPSALSHPTKSILDPPLPYLQIRLSDQQEVPTSHEDRKPLASATPHRVFWIHHCLTFRSVWVMSRKFPTSQEDRKPLASATPHRVFWIHHCLTFRSVWVTSRKFPTSHEDRKPLALLEHQECDTWQLVSRRHTRLTTWGRSRSCFGSNTLASEIQSCY